MMRERPYEEPAVACTWVRIGLVVAIALIALLIAGLLVAAIRRGERVLWPVAGLGILIGAGLTLFTALECDRGCDGCRIDVASPVAGEEIVVAGDAPATQIAVSGLAQGLSDETITVLIKPTNPPAAGWWAAEPAAVGADGRWSAVAWLGSTTTPAGPGHEFSLVALHTDRPVTFVESLEDLSPDVRSVEVAIRLAAQPGVPTTTTTTTPTTTTTTPTTTTTTPTTTRATTAATTTTAPPSPPTPRPLALEGERAAGDGEVVPRSTASGGRSRLLLEGERAEWRVILAEPARLTFTVRYSNDNFGELEQVALLVDGVERGSFTAVDTGDFGAGWDVFVDSTPVGPFDAAAGQHIVEILVAGGDGGGVEIDTVVER